MTRGRRPGDAATDPTDGARPRLVAPDRTEPPTGSQRGNTAPKRGAGEVARGPGGPAADVADPAAGPPPQDSAALAQPAPGGAAPAGLAQPAGALRDHAGAARAAGGGPFVPAAPVSLFGERWPGPPPPPSRVVLGAAGIAALASVVAVPEGRPGLGWLVTAVVLAALAVAVRWHGRPTAPNAAAARSGAGWGALAVGLAAVSTLRDAEWLVTVCLVAAVAAGSMAVAGRAFRSSLVSAVAMWIAAARAVPWVVRGVPRGVGGARTGVSLLAGAGLLAVFLPLLASADAAFARAVEAVVPVLDGDSAVRAVVLAVFGAAVLLGSAFLLLAPPEPGVVPPRPASRLRPLEWALPLLVLAALFAAFLAVQLVTLLGGDEYVRATTGVTYAEYARSGFWELLAVTALALGVILLGRRLAPAGRRAPLALLALLTLGIVAVALGRMSLYQQAYGFTVLRLVVTVFELWLGAGFVLVLVGVVRGTAPVRGMVVTGAVTLLGLALADPERIVAEQNVVRYAATGNIDLYHLGTLSADAVPALAGLPEPDRSCVLARIVARTEPGDWRSLNAARAALPAAVATPAECVPERVS